MRVRFAALARFPPAASRGNSVRLASSQAGIVGGVERTGGGAGQVAVGLRALEIRQEAVGVEVDLVEIEAAVELGSVVADIPRLQDEAPDVVLDADVPLL